MVDLITTDLTPVPARTRPTTYSSEADTFDAKLPAWADEANALATGANMSANLAAASAASVTGEMDAAEASAIVANSAMLSSLEYSNTSSSFASNSAEARDYVAEQSAFVASIYGLVGIGIDSAGNLSANINSESNISDMALNSDGELIVTYS